MFGLIWPIRGKASEMDGRWNYHNKRRRRGGNDWCRPSIRKDHRVVCTWVKCAPPVPSLEEEAARPFVHGPVNPRDVTSSCRENSLVSKRSASYAQYTSFHQSRGSRHLFTYFCFFHLFLRHFLLFLGGGGPKAVLTEAQSSRNLSRMRRLADRARRWGSGGVGFFSLAFHTVDCHHGSLA